MNRKWLPDLLAISQSQSILANEFNAFCQVGVEVEFYLQPLNKGESLSSCSGRLADFLQACRESKLNISEERGKNQYELTFGYNKLEIMQNLFMHNRQLLLTLGNNYGLGVDFSAKPFIDDYGSAMHVHLSLHDITDGHNLYTAGKAYDENHFLLYSIGGIMQAIPDFLSTCQPLDFKRFQSEFMAPSHYAWGGNNRSTIIRIPDSTATHRRIEFRLPPASANLQLVLQFLLNSTLTGLQEKIMPPARVYGNAFDPQYNLPKLPQSADQLAEFLKVVAVKAG